MVNWFTIFEKNNSISCFYSGREIVEGDAELNTTVKALACDLVADGDDDCDYEPTYAIILTFFRINVFSGMDELTVRIEPLTC